MFRKISGMQIKGGLHNNWISDGFSGYVGWRNRKAFTLHFILSFNFIFFINVKLKKKNIKRLLNHTDYFVKNTLLSKDIFLDS